MNHKTPTIKKQFYRTPIWHFILSIPFIYGLFLPMILLDLLIEIYQHVCFPLYGLKLISRKQYFQFDRGDLPKLNWIEKINCQYCGYANGLAAYFVAIAGETEAYWCAIKHQQRKSLETQSHTKEFVDKKEFE